LAGDVGGFLSSSDGGVCSVANLPRPQREDLRRASATAGRRHQNIVFVLSFDPHPCNRAAAELLQWWRAWQETFPTT